MMIVISFAQMNVLLRRHCVQPKEFAQAPLPVPDPIPQNSPLRPWQATAAKDRAGNQGKPPRMLPICPKGAHFRGSWARISDDREQLFRGIV